MNKFGLLHVENNYCGDRTYKEEVSIYQVSTREFGGYSWWDEGTLDIFKDSSRKLSGRFSNETDDRGMLHLRMRAKRTA